MKMELLALLILIAVTAEETCAGWIDPDTPEDALATRSFVDDRNHKLVFSDEFNMAGRTFRDGEDPRWTAVNKDDYTNFALHYYNHDLVSTANGALNITTILEDIEFTVPNPTTGKAGTKMTKHFQSGMIQGWNKFCFTGGIIEFNAQLPGPYDIAGLWPAMWLLGNLARATYVESSNNMWPWSFDDCVDSLHRQQAISSCNSLNFFDLHPHQGRGAPEIDILEAMAGVQQLYHTTINRPYFSTSFQVAPGITDYRPMSGLPPKLEKWYNKGLEYGSNQTDINIFFYGTHLHRPDPRESYLADAVSANTNLKKTHFTSFHKYRLEWQPGRTQGYLKWYLDGEFLYSVSAETFADTTGAVIPEEPMYILLNTALSSTWGFPNPCPDGCTCDCFDPRKWECTCGLPPNMAKIFPANFLVDSIRVYQAEGDDSHIVGCSTPDHPTSKYIEGHKWKYVDPYSKVKSPITHQVEPLLPVQAGGAACPKSASVTDSSNHSVSVNNNNNTMEQHSKSCGRGQCDSSGHCLCDSGYTGPTCRAAVGFNDVDWEPVQPIVVEKFVMPPMSLLIFAALLVALFTAFVVLKYRENKLNRNRGYVELVDSRR